MARNEASHTVGMTFLSYLALPNPKTDSTACKGGSSTKTSNRFFPDRVEPWKDFTLDNFELNFKDILLHQMEEPKVRNAEEISPERTLIYEESSVRTLITDWNEKVVQHVLDGTQPILHREMPNSSFGDGKIYFTDNRGQANISDITTGNAQKPDWCLYRKREEGLVEQSRNLLPGDTKPAKKWKSEWITSIDVVEKRKAYQVLTQLTKYMRLGNTRYGFVISEEEIVALRLSTFNRLKKAPRKTDSQHRLHFDSLGEDPDGSYGGTANPIGTHLEFCSIPWASSGIGNFTVNLTLWWLSVLAIRDPPIREVGTYTPLGVCTRGFSPAPVGNAAESTAKQEPHQRTPPTPHKRKASNAPDEAPIIRRSARIQKRTKLPDALSQGDGYEEDCTMADSTDPGQSFMSTDSSRTSKRQRT
ncbi:hypothetical protein F5Y10DRAFT_251779 [Nemania abortiva]|nr:hypothetical protein F5Y10DRAFT_251779 [Nemania abortiva]